MSVKQCSWEELVEMYGFPDNPVSDWPPYSPGAQSLQPGELRVYLSLLQGMCAKSVVEIGVNEGHIASAVLAACPSVEHYLGVDIPNTLDWIEPLEDPAEVPTGETITYTRNNKLIRGHHAIRDTRFALLLAPGGLESLPYYMLPTGLDAVLIDGDHRYKPVKWDTAWALSAVRPGGLIVWHDIELWPGVKSVVEEFPKTVYGAGNIGWYFKETT